MVLKSSLRNKGFFGLVLLVMIFFVGGCSTQAYLDRSIPKDADKFARDYMDLLIHGDYKFAKDMLNANVVDENTLKVLEEVGGKLRQDRLVSIKPVNVRKFSTILISTNKRAYLTYVLTFENSWKKVTTVVDFAKGRFTIYGFHIMPLDGPWEEVNKFEFYGKPYHFYMVLAVAIIMPLFTLYGAFMCWNTQETRRWFWTPFMLFGIGQVSINWTTGFVDYNPIAFTYWPVWIFSLREGVDGPWLIPFTMPVASIFFFYKEHKKQKALFVKKRRR